MVRKPPKIVQGSRQSLMNVDIPLGDDDEVLDVFGAEKPKAAEPVRRPNRRQPTIIRETVPEEELFSLPWGAKLMTLECGVRFLTDYLNGDTYFSISYPEHNLIRARNQFRLVEDMERKWDDMWRIVQNMCRP